jgi:hypothetical protein
MCQQRHRLEHDPADDLGDHHRRRQPDHPPRATLAARLHVGAERVFVLPSTEVVEVHEA